MIRGTRPHPMMLLWQNDVSAYHMFIKQYTLTRIILQRHKSFLLPSNFSPRVVQQLRHPPIMILLLQRIIRMLLHRIILRRYQPRLLLPLLQTIRRRRHANGGKHVMVTRLLSGMPMRRNRRVIWMMSWTMCVETAVDWKTVLHRGFLRYNLDELITWGGHEYNHHNLDGIDQQNDVISLRKKTVN